LIVIPQGQALDALRGGLFPDDRVWKGALRKISEVEGDGNTTEGDQQTVFS